MSCGYTNNISGLMALPRSPLHGPSEEMEKEAEDVVDASTLPPG
jgi:acetolactate synthase-1/3 small subunit